MAEVPPIVSAEWLQEQIDSKADHLRILDVSWASDKHKHEDFLKCHIPGAQYFNMFKDANFTEVFPRNVPEGDLFQKQARDVGIDSDTHVVVYDTTGNAAGFFIGARCWWTFKYFGHDKVSVLDGGLQKWKENDHLTTAEITTVKQGNFKFKIQTKMIKTFGEMKSVLKNDAFEVTDSRPTAAYAGNPENEKSGHFPGAKNITMATKLINQESGTFKSPEEIQKVFSEAKVDLKKPMVSMCFSGMSSCSLILASHMVGNKDAALYLGGMTEWTLKNDPSLLEKS